MTYKRHIDGLRAIAVLSVIFFHYDLPFFNGGFVGVDIFFVISGFLISNIIYSEVKETNNFEVSRFYARRVKRLAPSLLTTIILVYLCALILFTSQQLASLGAEMINGLLSVANILFWTQSSYFDVSTETKPLLHLWSLSVEEQFYLFWPFLLLYTYRAGKNKGIYISSIVVFALSLTLAIILTNNDFEWFKNQQEGIFYLTPFRVYEFLIGALGVVLINRTPTSKTINESLFILGLLGILTSIVIFNNRIAFPYYTALLPCMATLVIIVSGHSTLSKVILENRLMVYIGTISYSLYLVHWPVIVFTKKIVLSHLSSSQIVLSMLVCIVISMFIHHFIETPLRSINNKNIKTTLTKPFVYGCVIISLLIIMLGCSLIFSNGYQDIRNDLYTKEEISIGKSKRYSLIKNACRIDQLQSKNCSPKKELQVLIYGNSHEPDGYNILSRITQDNDSVNLILFGGTNHCILNIDESKKQVSSQTERNSCNKRYASLNQLEFIKSIDTLVFSSNKPFQPNKKTDWQLIELLKNINPSIEIIVLGTYFNTRIECSELINQVGNNNACKQPQYLTYEGSNEAHTIRAKDLKKRLGFIYFSKFKASCNSDPSTNEYTNCATSYKDEPMFYDQHHLSYDFAEFIGMKTLKVYNSELKSLKLVR